MNREAVSEVKGEPHSPTERVQTRGFMFADLRGYTEFVDRRGDVAAARLIKRYREVVRRAVADFEGAEIRTEGDGFYVVFPSASSAVECGLVIVEAADRESGPDDPLRVAIGIHAGETAETAEGYVGAAVNTAARIASAARANEVLVSETVRSLTRTRLPVRFVARGAPRLKGLAEPIALYRAVRQPQLGQPVAEPTSRRRAAGAIVLVVAALATALGVLLVLSGVGSPDPSPPPGRTLDPSGRPAATSSVQTAGLSVDERDLLELIPGSIGPRCVPESRRPPGTASRLRCPLPLGADADTVWYERYSTKALLDIAIAELEREHVLKAGDCSTASAAAGDWRTPLDTFSGRLLCYSTGGTSSITWTYDDDSRLILATASRNDSDWAALHAWWEGVGPFLR